MKEEKFKVIQFIRNLILIEDKELENFPKREVEIKDRIRSNTYDILEIVYEANATENEDNKINLVLKALAKVKVVDYLINLSYEKRLISEKKYYKLAKCLDDISKFAVGWAKKLNDGRPTWMDKTIGNN